jgi:tRNA U54 and U55 pseudouridine synthase Pus10
MGQIFWDIDSYLNIVMRHVKQLQIGRFKNKSPFPYKFEDLQNLIEKVLGKIEDEIKRHFDEKPGPVLGSNLCLTLRAYFSRPCTHGSWPFQRALWSLLVAYQQCPMAM